MQFYKGDDTEKKFYESGRPMLEALSLQKDLFYTGAYEAAPLGDALYTSKRSPLTKAIAQDIFRTTFKSIFDAFLVAGSFESYLTVFRAIFGSGVGVTFTVPDPGKLTIAIVAEGVVQSTFVTRYISSNNYVYDDQVTWDAFTLVLQTIKGFQSQYELEQMLFEMVPGGIYTQISLTLGSA